MAELVPYSGVENLEIMQEAENYNRYLLNTIRKHAPSSGRILDFGAGNGEFAGPIAALGFDVTALEPDEMLRTMLRSKGIAAAGTLHELPDQSFEYVYTVNVLEHIEDDVATLRQLHSKLSARGRLLVYVPAFPVLYTSMDAKVGHVRRYTRDTLVKNVAASGFDVERVGYVDSIGFFATLLFKLAGNKDGNVNREALKMYDRCVFPLSRALDIVTKRWFGKNLLLLAGKRASP
jgi:SAM-dependent methyltransferase